jgi:hypothetical protein
MLKNFKKLLPQKFIKLNFFRANKHTYKHEEAHKRILATMVTTAP